MAATLDADQGEVVHFSFPIDKSRTEETAEINPVNGTPDLLIWGKATDGTIDGDHEIVDPDWSAKAIQEWAAKGNIRMSHDPRRPVGRGKEVQVTTDGHWVKSLIADPLAKHFIRIGALNDYSVGISNPDFRYGDRKLDPEGKALRVITGKADGSTRIAEISVVDRGSNFNSAFQIVRKSAGSGGGFIGKMVGPEDEITKAAPAALVKAAREEEPTVTVELPKSATVTFSPGDLAKLLDHRRIAEEREEEALKAVAAAESAVYKRDIDTATRRRLAGQGRALPDGSYPIETHEDADDAATLALSGHGNVTGAKNLIRRIARKEGWQDILARLDGKKGKKEKRVSNVPDEADKGAVAAPPATAMPAAVGKDDGGDEHEPVLHHDDGQDDDTESDADAMDKAAAPGKKPRVPCPKCKANCKPSARFCGKCGAPMMAEKASQPTPDGGAMGAAESAMQPAPEHREPDGPAIEALEHDAHLPTVPDASMKASARLRDLGVPLEHGRLHDLLCPAYSGDSVKAAWPGADFSLIDDMTWQAKALEIAASAPLEEAREAAKVWQSALTLKAVTPDLADDIMAESRKAFRDANPGPGSAPEPGEMSAQRYNRPLITAGHSAPSPGQDPPNSSPIHPEHIAASDFARDLITAGHAADSPDNASPRPAAVPAPEVPGVPSRVFYTNSMRQNARQAMASMHDHIASTFPDLCPMHGPGRMGEPPSHARPVPVGVGGPVPHSGGAMKADAAPSHDGEIDAKAAEKAAKKELRRKTWEVMDAVRKGDISIVDACARLDLKPYDLQATAEPAALKAATAAPTLDPGVIEAAVTKATAPLMEKLAAQDDTLAEQRRLIDAIADQPDPAVTAYRGAALTKSSTAPAGPLGMQQRAALAQENLIRDRSDTARNSPDPSQRLQAIYDLMEYHGLLTGGTRT